MQSTLEYQRMWALYYTMSDPRDAVQTTFFQESMRQLNEVGIARRQRLLAARAELHPIMWSLLIFGGVVMIIFTYIIGAENVWIQSIVTGLLAVMLAFSILIVAAMEHPFAGDVSVTPDAFTSALASFQAQKILAPQH